ASSSVKGKPESAPAPSSGGFLTQDVLNVSALPSWIVKVRTGSDVAILIARPESLFLAETAMLAVSNASTNPPSFSLIIPKVQLTALPAAWVSPITTPFKNPSSKSSFDAQISPSPQGNSS